MSRRRRKNICAPRSTGRSADLGELDRDRPCVPRPARKTLSLAPTLVLAVEELTGELVLLRSGANHACRCARGLRSDPEPNARCPSQVSDPVRAVAAAREHVDAAVVQCEPDLDRVLFAGTSAGRREIREVLLRKALEHLPSERRILALDSPARHTARRGCANAALRLARDRRPHPERRFRSVGGARARRGGLE